MHPTIATTSIAIQPRPSLGPPRPSEDRENVTAHYCITRADLPTGVQAAQLVHAAGESSPGKLPPHTFAFALVVKDEAELKELGWQLFKNGVPHRSIYEPDAPWNGQMMAIGVVPGPRPFLRKFFSKLPLLK